MDGKGNNCSTHSLSTIKLTMKITICSCNHSTKDMITILVLEDFVCLETLENNITEFWAADSLLELEKTPSLNRWRKGNWKGWKHQNPRPTFHLPDIRWMQSERSDLSGKHLFHLESCELYWVFLEVYPLYGASNLFLNILNTTINIPKHFKALGKHIGRWNNSLEY